MRITRRDFMKYCAVSAGALGLTAADLGKIEKALATDASDEHSAGALQGTTGTHVVWLNGAACTGCTVSLANVINAYSIEALLAPLNTVEILLPAKQLGAAELGPNGPLDLDFMETLSSAVGERAVNAAYDVMKGSAAYALCIEGAIQTGGTTVSETDPNKDYCQIWRAFKKHSVLKAGSLVWASADREALKVPNTPQPIKVVNPFVLADYILSTDGPIELHPGSVLPVTTDIDALAGSWIEKEADRKQISLALGGSGTAPFDGTIAPGAELEVDGDNKIVVTGHTSPIPDPNDTAIDSDVTLTGRLVVAPGSLLPPGTKISSCSLIVSAADRAAIAVALVTATQPAPIFAVAAPVSTEDRTIFTPITLTGTVMIAPNSNLTKDTVLKIGTWVEDSGDRGWLQAPLHTDPSPTAFDADNKITAADVKLLTGHTFAGHVEAVKGCILDNFDASADGCYLSTAPSATDRTFADEVLNFAISDNCKVVIAVGTCASFGGIPAAKGSVTGARGLISTGNITDEGCPTCGVNVEGYWDYLYRTTIITRAQWEALMCKTVCVPGCPPHPDWIVGTIVYWLKVQDVPVMDKYHRPLSYYQEYQCKNCIWQDNDTMNTALGPDFLPSGVGPDIDNVQQGGKSGRVLGNSPKLYYYKYNTAYEGCLGILGCKGRKTKADCSYRRWNGNRDAATLITGGGANVNNLKGGVSWCVLTRGGCHGCTEPRFPDGWGPFFMYK